MISALANITWKQWRRYRLRTLLTLLGIALGVAVFFAVRTANVTLISSLTTTIEKSFPRSWRLMGDGEGYAGREDRRAGHRSGRPHGV